MSRHEPSAEVDELAHDVIGAAIDVHRALGPGLFECVYQNAMRIALTERQLPFEEQKIITVRYRGLIVGEGEIDYLVGGLLVVELKAVARFASVHEAQVRHYLLAGGFELGLLLNFHEALMADGIRRVVQTQNDSPGLRPPR